MLVGESALDAAQQVFDAAEGGLEGGAPGLTVELAGVAEDAINAIGHLLAVAHHRATQAGEFGGESVDGLLIYHNESP